MNLKLEVFVTKKQFERVIEYHRQCGFTVTVKEEPTTITFLSNAPGYECTPVAEAVLDTWTGRWSRWIYIRLGDRS